MPFELGGVEYHLFVLFKMLEGWADLHPQFFIATHIYEATHLCRADGDVPFVAIVIEAESGKETVATGT